MYSSSLDFIAAVKKRLLTVAYTVALGIQHKPMKILSLKLKDLLEATTKAVTDLTIIPTKMMANDFVMKADLILLKSN